MNKRYFLYIGIILLILGFLFVGISSNVKATSKTSFVVKENFVWNATGHYNKGDIMIVEVKSNSDWRKYITHERTVMINVSITGPDNNSINFKCYFYVYVESGITTPTLSPLNASATIDVGSSSNPPLSVEKVQNQIGGVVNKEGNFTVFVDKQSIYLYFGSTQPPNILLEKKEVYFPYSSLLPVGVTLAFLGVIPIAFSLYAMSSKAPRRKRKSFRKP